KKSAIENVDNENIQIDESQQIIVANPLSSSLGMPFSNIDLNSHIVDNSAEELCHS
ncbi:19570_t:CDS:2, partial [Gigaspora rosea]